MFYGGMKALSQHPPPLLWKTPPLARSWRIAPSLWIKACAAIPFITFNLDDAGVRPRFFSSFCSLPWYYQSLAGVLNAGAQSGHHHYIRSKHQ